MLRAKLRLCGGLITDTDTEPVFVTAMPNGYKCPFGCNGYINITAMAVGQSEH